MTTDLNLTLSRLRAVDDHPALDGIGAQVLGRIHAEGAARGTGLRLAGIAAIGAAMLGMVAADPWSSPAAAASPLGSGLALAPSTLLVGQ
jgi:hypothetical protein